MQDSKPARTARCGREWMEGEIVMHTCGNDTQANTALLRAIFMLLALMTVFTGAAAVMAMQ